MAPYSASTFENLSERLSSCISYIEAVEELRTVLLHSSSSYLVLDPEKFISLVEVAKGTLQKNGVSLHTFASCPDSLSPYKASYFALLLQLQAHSQNIRLDSRDLQVRLSRLLFPLSTQLKVCTKASGQDIQLCGLKVVGKGSSCSSPTTKVASSGLCLPSESSHKAQGSTPPHWVRSAYPPNLPPNIMLPPPAPIYRSGNLSDTVTSLQTRGRPFHVAPEFMSVRTERGHATTAAHRRASRDTLHFKHRNPEPVAPSPRLSGNSRRMSHETDSRFHTSLYDQDEENPSHDASADDVCLGIEASGSASDAMDEDEDEDEDIIPLSVIVPAPLRRSFGIFCTGKGRGAFSGSVPRHRPRHKEPQFSMSPRNDALNR